MEFEAGITYPPPIELSVIVWLADYNQYSCLVALLWTDQQVSSSIC